jgi:Domain of unknown function (DUF4139)/N-terminal domain of unknown function (DUF4140)
MKNFMIIMVLIVGMFGYSQPKGRNIPSNIEEVVVYFEGAQIKRTASTRIETGVNELIFSGISPNIDKQSLRVKGKGKFTILNVIHQINHLNTQKSRQEINELEKRKNLLNDNKELENNIYKILENEKNILIKNQSIGGTNQGIKTLELKEAVDFHRIRLTDIFKQQTDISKKINAIDTTLTAIEKQMQALNKSNITTTGDVIVTIKANEPIVKADFEINYYVKDAGWFADYDLRVKDVASPINWVFKANIFQQSGEDWKNVKISISNGNPTENGVLPKLNPWYLNYNSNLSYKFQDKITGLSIVNNKVSGVVMEGGQPLPGVSINVKGTSIGTETDFNGNFTLNVQNPNSVLEFSFIGMKRKTLTAAQVNGSNINMEYDEQRLSEVVVTGYGSKRNKAKEEEYIPLETKVNYQPTTINYEIKEPFTVLNNRKVHKTEIKTFEVKANFEYVTVPKIDPSVYLNAKVVNWQDLNLFDGEINLFFEDEYQGKSLLDLTNSKDTLNISLGKDKGLLVERKSIKDFASKQFLSNYKTESKAFEIALRNNKYLPVEVVVYDQFPISSNKEISVEKTETNGEIEQESQIITWRIKLEPKTEKKLSLKYQVKYPKDKYLYLE